MSPIEINHIDNTLKHERTCIFIRHGETEMNDEDVARGWTDVPLDVDDDEKLIALSDALKKYSIDGIFSSSLLRTLQTAHFVSCAAEIPILGTNSFLHTWNIGKFTGKNTKIADPILETYAKREPYKTIPDGESFNEFKVRFLMGLIGCLNSHKGKLLAFVTHGRNLATLNAWAMKDYPDDFEVDSKNLGYDEYDTASAHIFAIKSNLLC